MTRVIRIQPMGSRRANFRTLPACPASGKESYASEDQALSMAIEYASMNRFAPTSRSAYKCDTCPWWHLTRFNREARP